MRQFTLSAAVFAMFAAAPAASQDSDTMSVTVAMSDLDLTKAADLARLDARINRAANTVCGSSNVRGVVAHSSFNICKATAMQSARTRTERAVSLANTATPNVLASRR